MRLPCDISSLVGPAVQLHIKVMKQALHLQVGDDMESLMAYWAKTRKMRLCFCNTLPKNQTSLCLSSVPHPLSFVVTPRFLLNNPKNNNTPYAKSPPAASSAKSFL